MILVLDSEASRSRPYLMKIANNRRYTVSGLFTARVIRFPEKNMDRHHRPLVLYNTKMMGWVLYAPWDTYARLDLDPHVLKQTALLGLFFLLRHSGSLLFILHHDKT